MMASNGETWIKARDRATGRPLFVAVPSRSVPGKFHLTNAHFCDCKGFGYRGDCAHRRAVVAELENRKPAPTPATLPAEGIAGQGETKPVRVPLVSKWMA